MVLWTIPKRSACFCRSWTNSSRIFVFSTKHRDWYVVSIFCLVSGIWHFLVTGKKWGYFIVTLHWPWSFFSNESIRSVDTPFSSSLSKYIKVVSSFKFEPNWVPSSVIFFLIFLTSSCFSGLEKKLECEKSYHFSQS